MTTPTASVAAHPDRRMFARLLEAAYEAQGDSQGDVAEWINSFMDDHDLEAELYEIERTADDDERDATMDAIAVIRNYRAILTPPTVYRELDYLLTGMARAYNDDDDVLEALKVVRAYRARVPAPDCDLDTLLDQIKQAASDDDRYTATEAAAAIRAYREAVPPVPPPYWVGQAAVSKWKNGGASPTPDKWVALARYFHLSLAEMHRLIVWHEMPESVVALQRRLRSTEEHLRDRDAELARIRDELARAERAQQTAEEELSLLRLRVEGLEDREHVEGHESGVSRLRDLAGRSVRGDECVQSPS